MTKAEFIKEFSELLTDLKAVRDENLRCLQVHTLSAR